MFHGELRASVGHGLRIEEAIGGSQDFYPDMLHFAVFGTCRVCREAEARDDNEA